MKKHSYKKKWWFGIEGTWQSHLLSALNSILYVTPGTAECDASICCCRLLLLHKDILSFPPSFLSYLHHPLPSCLPSFLPLRDLLSVNLLCKPITQGRIVNIQVVWTLNDSKNNNTLSPDVAVDESVWKKEWEKGDKYEDLTREDKNVEYEAILLSR